MVGRTGSRWSALVTMTELTSNFLPCPKAGRSTLCFYLFVIILKSRLCFDKGERVSIPGGFSQMSVGILYSAAL
uniref:Uncharacterized protein n=1 Tax=Anguilla anguilla TaxID=7936 RepID=A0A0E9WWC5_ANGAN